MFFCLTLSRTSKPPFSTVGVALGLGLWFTLGMVQLVLHVDFGSRVHLGLLAEREVARSRRLLSGTQICSNSFAYISCADCSLVYSDRQIQQAVCDSSRVASCLSVCLHCTARVGTAVCSHPAIVNSFLLPIAQLSFTATADSKVRFVQHRLCVLLDCLPIGHCHRLGCIIVLGSRFNT